MIYEDYDELIKQNINIEWYELTGQKIKNEDVQKGRT